LCSLSAWQLMYLTLILVWIIMLSSGRKCVITTYKVSAVFNSLTHVASGKEPRSVNLLGYLHQIPIKIVSQDAPSYSASSYCTPANSQCRLSLRAVPFQGHPLLRSASRVLPSPPTPIDTTYGHFYHSSCHVVHVYIPAASCFPTYLSWTCCMGEWGILGVG
jgi:hypothetical protein